MRKEPVLVSGATGYVGGRLVPLLLDAGYRVRVLGRSLPNGLSAATRRTRGEPYWSRDTGCRFMPHPKPYGKVSSVSVADMAGIHPVFCGLCVASWIDWWAGWASGGGVLIRCGSGQEIQLISFAFLTCGKLSDFLCFRK